MDMRINQSPLFTRLNQVDKTKRVNAAKQKEQEQDASRFSDQLKMAQKKDEDEQPDQEEQDQDREGRASANHTLLKKSEGPSVVKPPDTEGQEENEMGTNIDIKV